MAQLEALGYDPIERMAMIGDDPETPIEIRARMASELAQYVAPKRKAVEHSGEGGGPVRYEVVTGVPASPESP